MFLKHPHLIINILRHNNFYESILRRDFVNIYLRLTQSCQVDIYEQRNFATSQNSELSASFSIHHLDSMLKSSSLCIALE